jgi:hypothetical protein
MKVWNSKEHEADLILDLPEGSYAASIFGQSVEPHHSVQAAEALKTLDQTVKVYSQAQAIVKAQELGVAFQDWMEFSLM